MAKPIILMHFTTLLENCPVLKHWSISEPVKLILTQSETTSGSIKAEKWLLYAWSHSLCTRFYNVHFFFSLVKWFDCFILCFWGLSDLRNNTVAFQTLSVFSCSFKCNVKSKHFIFVCSSEHGFCTLCIGALSKTGALEVARWEILKVTMSMKVVHLKPVLWLLIEIVYYFVLF